MAEPSTITTKDVVLRLEGKVDQLVTEVAELKGSVVTRVDNHDAQLLDHERRLRSVEEWRNSFPTFKALSAVSAVVASAAAVVAIFH